MTEAHSHAGDSRGTCQDLETNRPTEAHSHSGDSRGRHLSGHGNKPTDRGALTFWRRHREALVKTREEIDRPRRTHFLETASGGTCQDTERNRPTEAHSPTGDGIGRYFSGPRKETDRLRCTHFLETAVVRTREEIDRLMRTHILETVEGGTCQDTETNRPSEAHSLPGDSKGGHWSGHGNKTDRQRCTHHLETVEGGTCQDTGRNRPTEARSPSGDGRGRHLSGHGKKPID